MHLSVLAFALSVLAPFAADSQTSVVTWGDNTYGQTNIPAGLTNVVSVVAGNTFVLALKSDGTIAAWGSNISGETTVPAGLSNVVALAGGNNFSVALQSNGTVIAWGDNSYGATNVPAGLSNVVAIAACNAHVDALESNGTVVTWGYYPLVGPAGSPSGVSNVVAISAGAYTSLAIKNDGTVTGWGPAANGELNFPAALTNVAGIAGGGYHCVAVRRDGDVLAWGFNNYGEANVPAGLSNAVAVTAGNYFSMALQSDGAVAAWGDNSYGQTNVPANLTNVVAISAGSYFAVALVNNGSPVIASQPFTPQIYTGQTITLYATTVGPPPLTYQWQLNGTNIDDATNQALVISDAQFTDIGDYNLIVCDPFGAVTSSVVPVSVEISPPFIVSQPVSQASFIFSNVTFSLNFNGSWPFSCQWFFNGTNIPGATNASLVLNNLQLSNAGTYAVAISNAYGAVISSNASLWVSHLVMWGIPGQPPGLSNIISICGIPAVVESTGKIIYWGSSTSPLTISAPNSIAAAGPIASSAFAFAVILFTNGNAFKWNSDGVLGLTTPASTNDVEIAGYNEYGDLELTANGTLLGGALNGAPSPPLSNVVAIATGIAHSLVLRSDGTLVAWGDNTYGQGIVPHGLSNAVAIAAGYNFNLALLTNGTVTAWGYNADGETNVPSGLSNVVAIAAGEYHGLALKNDGTVVAWGSNLAGQTNFPAGLSNVVAIAAGASNSIALVGNGPPVTQIFAANPIVHSSTFALTIPTISDHVYALDFKRTLKDTNWTILPLSAGTGTNIVLTDTKATNSTRFYRVRRW